MIARTFRELGARGETALIPYLTAGYPSLQRSMEDLQIVIDNGADLVELGVPFSDPVADGPTIQHASQHALQSGAGLSRILEAISQREIGRPLLLMSYLNPLLAYGREAVLCDMRAAGVSGLIVPDVPLEEAEPWRVAADARGLDLVLLVAPTSGEQRTRTIAASSRGFVYYVSVAGVTGARQELPDDLLDSLAGVKRSSPLPVAVGFGISDAEQVRTLRGRADGVVVGSRIVEAVRRGEDLAALVRKLKQATRSEACLS